MMFEIAVQRLVDDFVVTMVLAFVPKRAGPGIRIFQVGERQDCRRALGKRNYGVTLHVDLAHRHSAL